MQTNILDQYLNTPQGQEADRILRSCVHCGFCTATCPTYQLLGDELDSPRGRIYLMKQVLEGEPVTQKTQTHLDRCLTCRACETTCPSGVQYGRLVDIGRHLVEEHVERGIGDKLRRKVLQLTLPNAGLFALLLSAGRLFKPLLPSQLQAKIPAKEPALPWPNSQYKRKMLVLAGCAQSAATPQTNIAAARVLDKLGIQLISASNAGCCGALSHHLSAHEEGLNYMRRNIDAWWPHVEQGAEAIVMTASGCGVVVKDYGNLLRHDKNYAEKAQKIAALTKDLSEILAAEDLSAITSTQADKRVAFHSPCTLQHGQQITGTVENILTNAGYELTPVNDSHLCCGSAGTYSILQPKLSKQLLKNKLNSLQAGSPELIVTANIGCQLHLASNANVSVKHWVELLAT